MSSQSPRIQAVRAAFLGEPTDVLDNAVADNVRRGLSSEQTKRLDAAVNERICIYPERPGLYRVRSPEGEHGDRTEYTVDLKYSEARTCTCGDFMYRLEADSGQMCKHLWRTQILINLGVLPEPTLDPYDWLLDELARDVQLLSAMESNSDESYDDPPSARLQALQTEMTETHRIAIEYPRICTERAEILSAI